MPTVERPMGYRRRFPPPYRGAAHGECTKQDSNAVAEAAASVPIQGRAFSFNRFQTQNVH
eukprot:2004185-Prymnesium_polylepis.1